MVIKKADILKGINDPEEVMIESLGDTLWLRPLSNKELDKLYFLEVNTTPGQSLNSIVPNQVRAMGKDVHWLYYTQMAEIL